MVLERTSVGGSDSRGGGWTRDLAQRHADDVVLAAAVFKPNAKGRFELSPAGFGHRQLLKSAGTYLAERVLLAVTPLHVHTVELVLGGRVARPIEHWPRHDVRAVAVPAFDPLRERGPALLLTRRSGQALAEVQALCRSPETMEVIELLLPRR